MDVASLRRLRDEWFFASWRMCRLLNDVAGPICQRNGLTLQQMHVLAELSRSPGLTAGCLSDRAGILRTNFAAVCRKLEGKGLVERARKDGDRRAYSLRVTGEGCRVLTLIEEDIVAVLDRTFDDAPPEDVRRALDGIQALNALMQRMEA